MYFSDECRFVMTFIVKWSAQFFVTGDKTRFFSPGDVKVVSDEYEVIIVIGNYFLLCVSYTYVNEKKISVLTREAGQKI